MKSGNIKKSFLIFMILFIFNSMSFSTPESNKNKSSELREIPIIENNADDLLNSDKSNNNQKINNQETEENLDINSSENERTDDDSKNLEYQKINLLDNNQETENVDLLNQDSENVENKQNNIQKSIEPLNEIKKDELTNDIIPLIELEHIEKPIIPSNIVIDEQEGIIIKEGKKEDSSGNIDIKISEEVDDEELLRVQPEEIITWDLVDEYSSAILGDLYGNIYYTKNHKQFRPLASVTKVMTLLVTFDAINTKKVSLNDKIEITKDIAYIEGSGIKMKPGEIFTLSDLIKASAIKSANNATYAIAKHVGGNVDNFVKMMNQKARSFGLGKELKFHTPAGLPTRMTKKPMDEGTALGIYKLSIEALKYKQYINIASIKEVTIHNNKIKIKNTNKLLGENGIYGIKTGFHNEAKYNITVANKSKNMHFITVVLGGKTVKKRNDAVLEIINNTQAIYENKELLSKNVPIGKVYIERLDRDIEVFPDKSLYRIVKKDENLEIILDFDSEIEFPLNKGKSVGSYKGLLDGKVIIDGSVKINSSF